MYIRWITGVLFTTLGLRLIVNSYLAYGLVLFFAISALVYVYISREEATEKTRNKIFTIAVAFVTTLFSFLTYIALYKMFSIPEFLSPMTSAGLQMLSIVCIVVPFGFVLLLSSKTFLSLSLDLKECRIADYAILMKLRTLYRIQAVLSILFFSAHHLLF